MSQGTIKVEFLEVGNSIYKALFQVLHEKGVGNMLALLAVSAD